MLDSPGSPVVKTLPSNVGDSGSILDRETEVPQAMGYSQKYKNK